MKRTEVQDIQIQETELAEIVKDIYNSTQKTGATDFGKQK